MRGSMERVAECTSTIYDGMIAMMEPEESWVARWQRISKWTVEGRQVADVTYIPG